MNYTPSMRASGRDSAIIRYNTMGNVETFDVTGSTLSRRVFAPGYSGTGAPVPLISTTGTDICSYYSSGKFLPGTTIKWTPNVSFNTTGRVYVGFTDNPEVIATLNGLLNTYVAGGAPAAAAMVSYRNAVLALGSVMSFSIWQETSIPFPTKLRRKRFDINETMDLTNADVIDRSVQTCMYCAITGGPTSGVAGQFEYHDVVDVEGIHGVVT